MSLFIGNNIIANNRLGGIYIGGLRAVIDAQITIVGNSIYGNGGHGVRVDISSDRAALGIPASMRDEDVLEAAKAARGNDATTAFEKIKALAAWADIALRTPDVIKRLIDFVR
jgi:hypothetical protein